MPFLALVWSWITKGGWKIFVAIGLAVGIIGAAWYVTDQLKKVGELTAENNRLVNEQAESVNRIDSQNQEILSGVEATRINTATIRVLRSQLDELRSTITADKGAAEYQANLQNMLTNQYRCMERISNGETDATCK